MLIDAIKQSTILVADDEDSLLKLAQMFFTQHGYHVLIGCGGDDALRVAEEYPGNIDLLLTDVRMPGMDGPTLLQTLRVVHPGLKVVYMTAYSPEEMAAQLPGEVVIQKPFELCDLYQAISDSLQP